MRDRDRHKQRIIDSHFAKDGEFTSTDAASYLRLTVSAAGMYCRQLVEDGKLGSEKRDNRVYFKLAQEKILWKSWGVADNGVRIGQHGYGYEIQ